MKVKRIKFVDSAITEEQTDLICIPLKITVIGFLVQETEEYITLARELLSNGNYRGQISIPKKAIIK